MGFVVVGVDGSDISTRALVWGMAFARSMDHQIVAVTGFVIPWTIFITPTYQPEDYARDAEEMLQRSVREAQSSVPDVTVEPRLVQESPSQALIMASHGAELLVVGARGHGALSDVHVGSVANACVNHAPCPVVVYRDPIGPEIV